MRIFLCRIIPFYHFHELNLYVFRKGFQMGKIGDSLGELRLNISTIILILFFCTFSFLALPLSEAFRKDYLIGLQFLMIGFISISALFIENQKHSFSASMSLYFFCYLFFYCAALFQFSYNTFTWFLSPTIEEIIAANNLILLGIVSFIFGNKFFIKVKFFNTKNEKENIKIEIRKPIVYIFLIILTIYFLYLLETMPLAGFFTRSIFQSSGPDDQSLGLIFTSIRNGMALISSLMLIEIYKQRKNLKNLSLMTYALLLSLFIIPPTGVARFLSGAFYGSIILYLFPSFRCGRKFLLIMFLFILIVFPLLNNFRYAGNDPLNLLDIVTGLSNNFQAADFDAYTMLIYTVQYVSTLGYSLGNQLIGTIFFFIPRTIWPSKPVGSGSMIVENLFIPINPNVSCPFFAEYYLNFGVLGVVIFSILLGCLLNTIDQLYWNSIKEVGFLKFFYPFLSLIIIFCCRGDMMSTRSFLIGTFISSYISYKMIVKKAPIK